jgi:hypothetical protein
MKFLRVVQSLLFLAVATTTLAQKVTVDYDHSANFQGYKTYAWAKGTPLSNQLWDQRIINGVDNQLTAKGFQKVGADANPDMYVLYHGAIGQQAQINTTNMGGWGWRWGGGMATTTVDRIPVGQLVVDIGDAKTKKLMWMANSSDTLADNPDKNQKKLNNALAKMFKNFPPPAK